MKNISKHFLKFSTSVSRTVSKKTISDHLCSQNALFLQKIEEGSLGLKKNLKEVAECRKNSEGGTLCPYFCKHKFFLVQCETWTHVPLLLGPRHQDGNSALTARPSGSDLLCQNLRIFCRAILVFSGASKKTDEKPWLQSLFSKEKSRLKMTLNFVTISCSTVCLWNFESKIFQLAFKLRICKAVSANCEISWKWKFSW